MQPTTTVFSDVGLSMQGRPATSSAAVTAFVDDLSGSAPLYLSSCPDAATFVFKIASFISELKEKAKKNGGFPDTELMINALYEALKFKVDNINNEIFDELSTAKAEKFEAKSEKIGEIRDGPSD